MCLKTPVFSTIWLCEPKFGSFMAFFCRLFPEWKMARPNALARFSPWRTTLWLTYFSLISVRAEIGKSEEWKSKKIRPLAWTDFLAPPVRLERTTPWLTVRCSNRLSYGGIWNKVAGETYSVSPADMSAMNYLPGPSPAKYFRHCRA